jgi:hypothetical protein
MTIKFINVFHCKTLEAPKFTQIWIFGLKICHLATQAKSVEEARSRETGRSADEA